MRRFGELRARSANRPLSALIIAGAISAFGDWLYLTALPIIVYQATHDAALVGLAAAGRLIPFFVLSLPAGLLADRFDRRRILVASESARAVLMLVMAGLYVGGAEVTVLIAVATGAAAFGTISMPALGALIPRLARSDAELGQANAWSATISSIACIAGPAAAGILFVTVGLGAAIAVNGLSFGIVVLVLLCAVPARGERSPATAASVAGGVSPAAASVADASSQVAAPDGPGWTSVFHRAGRQVVLDAAISFGCGALGVLPVLIAVDRLGAGEAFVGVLGASAGVGAVLGGVAAGVFVNRRPTGVVACSSVLAGVAIAGLAATSSPPVAVAALAAAVGLLVMLDTLNVTFVQRHVPAAALGRAFGVLHTSAAAWIIAGSAVPPIVAAALGLPAALALTAIVVAGVGTLSLVPVPERPWPVRRRDTHAPAAAN